MTYEMYRNIFMVCAVAGAVMAFVSILLFILLRIPAVIGDLTGITARKGIEQIRSGNAKMGKKKYSPGKVNRQREKLTAEISPSGGLQQQESLDYGTNTEKLRVSPGKINTANETTVLDMGFKVLEDITIIHTEEEI